ncbi:MAG TPA: 2-C-methyl-D-erythritol 4-phosphate cytidylyltransferase [Planctomycetaceae bacterium]|nr:2-C-methyl-D-erythritol 4-phosphate cytidylyltransferase [Planctomycetaceae bacterium]
MAKFAVILPAAGMSSRFGGAARKKVFADLAGRAVWLRSTELFVNRDDVVQTLLVVAADDEEWFREKFRPNLAFLDVEVVVGGAERADSVANALARVKPEAVFIAVHDAARPLIAKEWITTVFKAGEQHGAAILATPVTSTVKRVADGTRIVETVPRVDLWTAQTPQVSRRDWLEDAFAKRGSFQPTDEAQLLERAGYAVHVVPGSPLNFKITVAEDLKMAEACLDLLPKEQRTGLLHPFADEDPRWP